jgi:3-hydroxymyristoyl/3-hydroxydecanoyl-(acyl carrier protein) dehydratase
MSVAAVKLSRADILSRVPHGPKALYLVDAVLCPNERALTEIRFMGSEIFFHDHYLGSPLLPGAVLLEIFGQLGAVLVSSSPGFAEGEAVLSGVEHLRFYRPIVPPCSLTIKIEIRCRRERVVWLHCIAMAGAALVARGILSVSQRARANACR